MVNQRTRVSEDLSGLLGALSGCCPLMLRGATMMRGLSRVIRPPVLARALRTTPTPLSGPFLHQNTEINSPDTPFEWDEESEKKIEFTMSK